MMSRCFSLNFLLLIIGFHLGFSSNITSEDEIDEVHRFFESTTEIAPPVDDEPTELTTETTFIVHQEKNKEFLTESFLNVNLSLSNSNLRSKIVLNHSILIDIDENYFLLIDKTNGKIQHEFKDSQLIPVYRDNKLLSDQLFIFDENQVELWIIDSINQHKTKLSFKPKRIEILKIHNEIWVAEGFDQLYFSSDRGVQWKKIDESSSSIILGWSIKDNALIINQHARFIKLLDPETMTMTSILNDVTSSKLFSQYFLAKQSTNQDALILSHVNNLADESFRPLPTRFQSEGNFYCAIEDVNSKDLLLLFITESRLGENNETLPSNCNLVGYSRKNRFSLPNIDCLLPSNETVSENIECSLKQAPIYQVPGLSKNIYLANVIPGPVTFVSLDNGKTWNKTRYQCDQMESCPNNVSLIIDSLYSADEIPGIVLGKASDGIQEFIAVSNNGGHLWFLTLNNNLNRVAISYPSGLLVKMTDKSPNSLVHRYQYSTDYGQSWHEARSSNDTSFEIQSIAADQENHFYLIAMNNQNDLSLIELDFNILITDQCARHQIKEWTLAKSCTNGSKILYKRRIAGAHCLDKEPRKRNEPCQCSLVDFQCAPGYRKSKDDLCLPRSHYTRSQDCSCRENATIIAQSRGYIKLSDSQCLEGLQTYLSDAHVIRGDLNEANLLLYGIDRRNNRSIIEIQDNGFDNLDKDDDEDDEEIAKSLIWRIDPSHQMTALTFDDTTKQIYTAILNEQSAIVYRINKNLRQQDRVNKQLNFDRNDEFYKNQDEKIMSLAIDWIAQNLYVLTRNEKTFEDSITLIDIRTRKRRVIVKNQRIEPPIILVDPIKANLYWMTQISLFHLNVANLQGQVKRSIQLSSLNSKIRYISYDTISHDILLVTDSTIYGLSTLNFLQSTVRFIYEHSSTIENPLFVSPILYFTSSRPNDESNELSLHSIDIVAKSFAKNIEFIKNFRNLTLFVNMNPTMPRSPMINPCTNTPCSDICIPLEQGRFRCLCGDDARYPTCSCPLTERFSAGSCQAKNEQCAPGRVLCQNRVNCAESALMCEQDHTQYTVSFKLSSRCTLDKPDDGFDCFYTGVGIHHSNNTCIPYQWLCDGVYDCPLGNDEDHCYKLTTTTQPASPIPNRCLIERRFTHVTCGDRCLSINNLCRNASNRFLCSETFHLNCKQSTNGIDEYDCKCQEKSNRCIAMSESCDDFDHCEEVCWYSIGQANLKSRHSGIWMKSRWIILVMAILIIFLLFVFAIWFCRKRKSTNSNRRTPTTADATRTKDSPIDVREKLLDKATSTSDQTS